ncbi:MAG: hypothetical protein HYV26_04260 [Candidatus Hydrogenedentes bacterium]|nr:hypothetical protein [Candidatus Hydrogenedentota bacterium]
MNLERVEELSLGYLRQSPEPVVPLEVLLTHCQHDEICRHLTRKELEEFLGRHPEVLLLSGPGGEGVPEVDMLEEAGVDLGPRAILRARIPPRQEMKAMILQQLDQMQLALNGALSMAQEHGDRERAVGVMQAIQRAAELRQKIQESFS